MARSTEPSRRSRPRVMSGPTQRIQAVDRAAALLQLIAASASPLTVVDLADRCGLNRSTTWRLLGTLEHHGLIERDPVSQGYLIGHEIVNMGARAAHESLVRLARPLLQHYASDLGETLMLAVPRRFDLVYVDQVNPAGVTRASWVDQPVALHATSGGKVFLASLSEAELPAFLSYPLERFTEHTITDPDDLMAALRETRELGYGCCDQEYEEYSNGVAAPVTGYADRLLAVVTLWGPAQRITVEKFDNYGASIIVAAQAISARFHTLPQ